MDYNQLTKLQFEEIMDELLGETVWLEVRTDTVSKHTFYENFEFLNFVNGKYQFGFLEYNEEREYENLMINKLDVLDIHRNPIAPSMGAEQVILSMCCGTEIFVEYNY